MGFLLRGRGPVVPVPVAALLVAALRRGGLGALRVLAGAAAAAVGTGPLAHVLLLGGRLPLLRARLVAALAAVLLVLLRLAVLLLLVARLAGLAVLLLAVLLLLVPRLGGLLPFTALLPVLLVLLVLLLAVLLVVTLLGRLLAVLLLARLALLVAEVGVAPCCCICGCGRGGCIPLKTVKANQPPTPTTARSPAPIRKVVSLVTAPA